MEGKSKLAEFLINRACKSLELANFLHWFFLVEEKNPQNKKICEMYKKLHEILLIKLCDDDNKEHKRNWHGNIIGESALVKDLIELGTRTSKTWGDFDTKKKKMLSFLEKEGEMHYLRKFKTPITCPVRP